MSCCGVTIQAHRNADLRKTYQPNSRYSFSGFTALMQVRDGATVLLTISMAATANSSVFSIVGDSLVLTIEKADLVALALSEEARILSYDIVVSQGGFEDWFLGGDFVLLALNDASVDGNSDVNVEIGGQQVDVMISGGNIGAGASVLLADLNDAAERAEAAAAAAEAAAGQINDKADTDGANTLDDFLVGVRYVSSLPNTFAYPLAERLAEERSIMEFIPPNLHAGIKNLTTTTPVDTYIQEAFDNTSVASLYFPPGLYLVANDKYLLQKQDGQFVRGAGPGTIIRRAPPYNVAARPLLITTGDYVALTAMRFEPLHQTATTPAPVVNNIAFASGIIMMGDNSLFADLEGENAWDNQISVGRFSLVDGSFTPGTPIGFTVANCLSRNAGCGVRQPTPEFPYLHQAGGGVNNLSGQGGVIRDCIDYESRTSFINDYASGASAVFSNCVSYYAKKSRVPGDTFPTEFSRYGGFGFYVAGRAVLADCSSFDAESDGLWMDGFSANCAVTNFRAKGAKQRAGRIQGRDQSIVGFISEDCSYMNTGLYPAVLVEGTSDGADGALNSRNIMINGLITTGPYHTYGLQVLAGGDSLDRKVQGYAANMQLNGTVGLVDNPNYASFSLRGYTTSVPTPSNYLLANSVSQWDGTQVFTGEGVNAVTSPWGDSAGRGQIWARERRNNNKRLALGFDGDRNVGVIQATEAGVASRAIDINPNPAETRTWNRSQSGEIGEAYEPALSANLTGSGKRVLFGYEGPNNRGVIQASEKGVAAQKLSINPYSGDVELGDGTIAAVYVSIPGIGLKKVEVGAADSGGAGYRMLRVLN